MATNNKQQQEDHYFQDGIPVCYALAVMPLQMSSQKRSFCKFLPLKSSSDQSLHARKALRTNSSMIKTPFRSSGNCNNVKENSYRNFILLFANLTKMGTTAPLKLFLFTLIILSINYTAVGEGNVGCKFVRTLCLDDTEVCYDDHVFGKCIPTTGINLEDIEKSPLTQEQSHLLVTMLEEMQGNGLGWDHPYVQCRIQGTLFSLEKQTPLPPNLCNNLSPIPPTKNSIGTPMFSHLTPLKEYASDYNAVKYFYPLVKKRYYKTDAINQILQELNLEKAYQNLDRNDMLSNDVNDRYIKFARNQDPSFINMYSKNDLDKTFRDELNRKLAAEAQHEEALHDRQKMYQLLVDPELDVQPFLRHRSITSTVPKFKRINNINNIIPLKRFSQENQKNRNMWSEGNSKSRESTFRELFKLNQQAKKINPSEQLLGDYFDPSLNETSKDKNSLQLDDSLRRNSLTPFEQEALLLAHSTHPKSFEFQRSDESFTSNEDGPVASAEVYRNRPGANRRQEEERKDLVREFFTNVLGFSRHERLDVKKPGPLIGPPPSEGTEELDNTQTTFENATKENVSHQHQIRNNGETQKKKKLIKGHSDEDHSSRTVDTEYAHIYIKNFIESWNDGVRIVTELANILQLQGYLTYLTVQPHEISFRVNSSNPQGRNAFDVAQAINKNRKIKNEILRRLGVNILKAGVGDKIKWDDDNEVSASYLQVADDNADITYILIYMFAGAGAAATVVLCITFILIKRQDHKHNKLSALQTSPPCGLDTCSKDYQELCRARMANKGEPISGGRITSLNKEGDRPPSSRSSTSSWCEEPALTNMDISTGHMVLSYMEDHLRNKDRLQREWEALCRYQAEPATRDVALQAQCINLNRPEAPLPYDHSRVVLNHLANADGLDYINASTITDHDPRTPAYIAAQGPLPVTLAHFWQMIWEQGTVVIVALCRLQENGGKACARYWPEEGADVYHIYEVHLVSEHIWCDDYLVRSFYLKNLRTSETRTVTQFHFLSWPQDGIPVQAKPLLDFRRKVNKSYRGRSCPIVVHSSNGAGRTGAYILLDLVLGRMNKGAREIDIAATLEHLRDQRADLVTTRQQFEFVLMAVAEEVHATLKALPTNPTAITNEKKELDIKGDKNTLKED